MHFSTLLVALPLLSSLTLAHPGHNVAEEAAERAEHFAAKPRSLRSCASQLEARGHSARSLARRSSLAHYLRSKRGLPADRPLLQRRDFAVYDFSHEASSSDYTLDTSAATIFADNSSCSLQPEVTEGPYYVNGELIRQSLAESQAGVPLTIDIQIIDTSTCEPVSDVYLDFWHCNSAGVYSGVVASGNGDSDDTSNLDNTFLRGIQQTDSDGIVTFDSLFPGHYTGRTTHVHILAHSPNATSAASNDTLLAGNSSDTVHATHVGQLFFDQSLISFVETVEPYASNTQSLTLNLDDRILGQEAEGFDPFVEYVLLGEDVSDGIFAWISVGIDRSNYNEVSTAVTIYEDGGVENGNSGMGGGPGGDGGMGPSSSTFASAPATVSGSVTRTAPASVSSGSGSSSTVSVESSNIAPTAGFAVGKAIVSLMGVVGGVFVVLA